MKRTFICLLTTFAAVGTPLTAALPISTNNASFTKTDEEHFYTQLQAGLKKSQDRVQQLQSHAAGIQSAFALENAEATLAIKQMMFNNFKGTPAIQFPEIRRRLLALFEKDEVSAQDLSTLEQAIHDWEQSTRH